MLVDEGRNLLAAGKPPFDDFTGAGPIRNPGHGTRTLSVLCGRPAERFSGCIPELAVVPYRVVDDVVLEPAVFGTGVWEALAAALIDAVHKGCTVVSISLGGFYPDRRFGEAVDYTYERGVILVAAAGQKSDRVTYPGKYARVFGVGGITWLGGDRYRIYNDYSDHSGRVDVWAPAEPVVRADPPADGRSVAPEDTGDGTSYATVHVAAAAAIWLAWHGEALAPYAGWRRVEAFWAALKGSQQPLPQIARRYLNGVLDATALLDEPLPDPLNREKNIYLAANESQ